MRIGFDAKRAFFNQTGLGHYSRTLISSLHHQFPENDYFLFSPKPSSTFTFPVQTNLHMVLPDRPLARKFSALWRSRWINRQLREQELDIYHGLSHELPIGIQRTGIRTVVTMHDLIFERYPDQYKTVDRLIYRQKFKYACRVADRIIAISEQTRKDLIDLYGTDPEKISVCYQSCNPSFAVPVPELERQRVRARYGLPDNYFLYVGSVIERKNLLGVCRAYAMIREETDQPLVIIGRGGSYLDQVKQYLRSEDLENRCIFLSENESAIASTDFQTAKDFPAIYQSATAMIYPSYYEGFGIPVLEAVASGIPVITSNCSCLPEAGGPGAFYVDPHRPESIAKAIVTILFDPEKVREHLQHYTSHLERFTNQATAAEVMKVYRTLTKE